MTTMTPLFSIITVCYNAADNLRKTIESVDSQSCRLYEHLIIDGASTDNTPRIVNASDMSLRRFYSEPDHGTYDAMNKGIGQAAGEYLIFLNAGDRFHSADTLQLYADAIMQNDRPGIVYGQTILVDADDRYVGPRHLSAPTVLTHHSFADGMLVCHQAMAVLKRIAPLYDTQYRFSSDYDWTVKCLMHSRHNVYIDTVVCDYLFEGLTTSNHKKSLIERFKIMCRYYGILPTVARHLKFAFRFFNRKAKTDSLQ